MTKTKLKESNIKLERNAHDNTCKVFSENQNLSLETLAPLSVFGRNTIIQSNTWTNSLFPVNVNMGLKYVTIGCGSVNTEKNFDTHRHKSRSITKILMLKENSLQDCIWHVILEITMS